MFNVPRSTKRKGFMEAFEMGQLLDRLNQSDRLYLEFLRVPALSAGLYSLPAGARDSQQPHTEDEVYYIVSGKAAFAGGDKTYQVQAGSVLFVEAGLEHRFFDIVEDLKALVFFAPAEYSFQS
jgi:mannose-6-phosphate isomerase-like protein (cupin superfamily)